MMTTLNHSPSLASRHDLEMILDHISDGIIGHGIDRRIIHFNRAAEKITGYRKDEVLGKDCHSVFGNPFCGTRCSFCGSPPGSWTVKSYPIDFQTKDGQVKHLEMTVTGMTDDNGRLTGILSSFRELTDLVHFPATDNRIQAVWGIVGRDPKMLHLFRQIQEAAGNDFPVHITGETGTGKELVANAIHRASPRRDGPFVPINCGALPEGVLESELFGHVRGAFTGAIRDKKGRFELADGGTIFLDEVADLPKPTQVKLLRVLEDGTFMPVGGERIVSVNVRTISATNRNLAGEVKKNLFREDLYYRLKVLPIEVPPVRERRGDIPLLVEHFLSLSQGCGLPPARLTKDALSRMMTYSWPGNVRQLQNAVHYALVKSKDGIIRAENLPRELLETTPRRGPRRKLTAEAVRSALAQTGGNKARAARILGVGRATLYRFLADNASVSKDTTVS